MTIYCVPVVCFITKLISYPGQCIQFVSLLPHLVKPGFCLTGINITEANLSNSENIHSTSQLKTGQAPSISKSVPRLLSDKTMFFSISEKPPGTLSFLCLEGPRARMSLPVQNTREFYGLHKRSLLLENIQNGVFDSLFSLSKSLLLFILDFILNLLFFLSPFYSLS